MITVDSREPDEIFEYLEEEGAQEVKKEYMDTGDFLVRDFIIERKQYGDFIGRMTQSERDIWQQMLATESAAEDQGLTPMLLFEGDWESAMQWSNLTPAAPTKAIASIIKLGISTVHLMGPKATAQFLVKLEEESTHGDVGSIRDTPSVPDELLPRYITESFQGVGPSRAESILERYGNFANIVEQLQNDPDDLKEISGIGDATVEKMVDMVTQEWE